MGIKKKDARKGNRHRPGYSTEYMRKYRARKALERTSITQRETITNDKTQA